ncbi:MAG: ABC transporter ATP-binding protein [Betaproteobacteria bacterium]|nr:ABC transporter ATP-binding protein [Betaproteobacteria bacterium]
MQSALSATPAALTADAPVVALRGVEFGWTPRGAALLRVDALEVLPGERLLLRGPSGSGKSTLLQLMAGVLVPRTGTVELLGQGLPGMTGARRDRLRADHVGFVFQLFNLIPYLTVVQNVTLPCLFSARRRARATVASGSVEAEARRLLGRLGLSDPELLERPVTALSVGQQQRVAAARALMGAPELLIADEATSALDADAREAFLDLLLRECAASGAALVFVSHDASLASAFHRSVPMEALNRG